MDARGTAKGPGLALNPRVAEQSADQLRAYLEHGNVGAGMPSFSDLPAKDLVALTRYLRRLNVETIVGPVTTTEPTRKITWGAPQPRDWLTYNGNDSANRFSPLKQITTANVSSLKLKWVFPMSSFGLETTPLAADGVLYVTGPNQVFALDALTEECDLQHYSHVRPVRVSAVTRNSAPIAELPFRMAESFLSPTTPTSSRSTVRAASCSGRRPWPPRWRLKSIITTVAPSHR